jgi:hypothetical protein
MTDAGPPPPRPWRRRLIVMGLVFGVAAAIFALSPTRRQPPPIKLPDPNGYDDLVQAGSLIHGDWPNKGDFAKAKVDDVRAFVEANKASLDRARVGLSRECVATFDNTQDGLSKHLDSFGRIRSVARLLTGEAIIREADGQPVEAARIYRDLLEVGQAMTQGGMGIDVSAMCAIQAQAITRLRALRDKLPSEAISDLLRDLESLDRRRVTPEDVEARRDLWYQGAFNSYQRAMMRLSGVEKKARVDELRIAKSLLDRIAARPMRFFMIELAIHAYQEDKKAWPRSVKDLVPGYLPSIPIDPSTGQPIDYPANPLGELTDDLTTIARPDGEVKPGP